MWRKQIFCKPAWCLSRPSANVRGIVVIRDRSRWSNSLVTTRSVSRVGLHKNPFGIFLRDCSTGPATADRNRNDKKFTELRCSGCGVKLQSQNESESGYVPSAKLDPMLQSQQSTVICKRCFLLKHYNTSLKVTLNEEDYKCHLQHLKHQRALILCMVDITDFPCSIFPNLVDFIGHRNPVLVIGNKLDMLPEDSFKTRHHVREVIRQGCQEAGFNRANIMGIHLVSAKTGAGINSLITDLSNNWGRRGDVYLLGSTNVGKSTLFNQLMELLCGLPVGHTSGATISRWPGTTLGLIRFPIASQSKRERMKRKAHHQETKMIGSLFLDNHNDEQQLHNDKQVDSFAREELSGRRQNWVYDTPGAINPLQLINHLTQEELGYVTQAKMLKPRTFILKPSQCLLIGGLARLDYTEGTRSIYLTVFRSPLLPIHTTWIERSEDFYEKHAGEKLLKIPIGGKARMKDFPQLHGQLIQVEGIGWKQSAADVVLSSAGWIAITAGVGDKIALTAHTPLGLGIFVRSPAILPYAVNDRGKRSKRGLRTEFMGK